MPPRKTTHTTRRTLNTRTAWKTTGRTTTNWANTYTTNSPKYRPAKTECQWRMGSYRNVYAQLAGNTRTGFSPATANRWIRYVNNGVRVYKFNNNEFGRYFGTKWTCTSPTATRQYLKKKYGAGIKDVTRGTNNCWLVATTKNITGRPFNNYNWM